MVCSLSLTLAIALMAGNIACSFSAKALALKSKFAESLDASQLKMYESIIRDRMDIYMQGMALGLLCAVVYVYLVHKRDRTFDIKHVGMFGLITLGVQYMYYSLMPKHNWMLDHLKNQEQVVMWLEVYKHMSMRWHLGVLLGILGSMVGCYACMKNN